MVRVLGGNPWFFSNIKGKKKTFQLHWAKKTPPRIHQAAKKKKKTTLISAWKCVHIPATLSTRRHSPVFLRLCLLYPQAPPPPCAVVVLLLFALVCRPILSQLAPVSQPALIGAARRTETSSLAGAQTTWKSRQRRRTNSREEFAVPEEGETWVRMGLPLCDTMRSIDGWEWSHWIILRTKNGIGICVRRGNGPLYRSSPRKNRTEVLTIFSCQYPLTFRY